MSPHEFPARHDAAEPPASETPSTSPGEREKFGRLASSWRRLTSRKPSAPPLPWARPRPQFSVPEPTDEETEDGDHGAAEDARPDAVQDPTTHHEHAAAPSSTGSGTIAHRESGHAPTVADRPIYVGFMVTFGVGLALLVYWVAANVGALGGWITGALFIALGLDPVVRWLESKGVPRALGVVGVLLVLAGFVVLLTTVVIPMIARQALEFINGFPDSVDHFLSSDFMTTLNQQTGIRDRIDQESGAFLQHVLGDSSFVGEFLNNIVQAGSTVAQVVTGTLIVTFLAIYFLASLPTIKAWGVRLAPRSRRARVAELTEKITQSVGHYVIGQAVVALLNAVFAFVVMSLLHLPFALLLAVVVAMLAFVPLVGGVCAGLLVTLLALVQGWQTALVYALCYFAYLQVEAYIISPRIMKRAVAVPGAIAVIAVAAGGALWGVLGALIAIPVAASLLLIVREVFIPRQDQR